MFQHKIFQARDLLSIKTHEKVKAIAINGAQPPLILTAKLATQIEASNKEHKIANKMDSQPPPILPCQHVQLH
jgi:hypothetical protein